MYFGMFYNIFEQQVFNCTKNKVIVKKPPKNAVLGQSGSQKIDPAVPKIFFKKFFDAIFGFSMKFLSCTRCPIEHLKKFYFSDGAYCA